MKIPDPIKLPSGNYNIRLRLNGTNISITKATAKECKREAELIKAEHLSGKRNVSADMTMREAVDRYINSRKNTLSPSTIRGYKSYEDKVFANFIDKPISKINFQKEMDLLAADKKPKTVKNAWMFCVSVLKYVKKDIPSVTLPTPVPNEHAFLTPDDVLVFANAVKGDWVEIPALLALHSLTRSELAGLEWKDIDLKNNLINIRGALVKDAEGTLIKKKSNKNAARTRTVPIMIPSLLTALQAVEDKSGYVCKQYIDSYYTRINKICELSGLPKVGVHGLRHSFASLAYNKLHLTELQTMELGGWSDYKTMRKIYTHLDEKSREDSRQKMQEFFSNCR